MFFIIKLKNLELIIPVDVTGPPELLVSYGGTAHYYCQLLLPTAYSGLRLRRDPEWGELNKIQHSPTAVLSFLFASGLQTSLRPAQTKNPTHLRWIFFVGMTGFEPATTRTPCV
ncbi:MAG: hypothetical protein JSW57_00915, partial [Flavobacteriaceae bacterium]